MAPVLSSRHRAVQNGHTCAFEARSLHPKPSAVLHNLQVQKISLLTPNIGVVYSGMGPDSRVLVRKARKQAQAYYRLYHEHIPVAQLVRETAAVMQEFTRAC